MALRYFEGTVRGQGEALDVEETSKKLRKAMKGLGTDEKAIIDILASHTNDELQSVKKHYKTLYGRILPSDIDSELSGHFGKLCLYLLLARPHFEAHCLHEAIDGLGTKERPLIEILCTRNNAQIQAIKEAYKERFHSDLEKDVCGDTSGHFRRLLVSVLQGGRSEEQVIDEQKVEQDVQDLIKAGTGQIGTDESEFNRILVQRSIPHLESVFKKYLSQDQRDIQAVVKSETSGHLRDGLLALLGYIQDPLNYFADCFHAAMKGAGTDDERLIQLVVSHCEIDLKDIADTYLKKHHVGLSRAIHDDTSGDYRKLLVRLTKIAE